MEEIENIVKNVGRSFTVYFSQSIDVFTTMTHQLYTHTHSRAQACVGLRTRGQTGTQGRDDHIINEQDKT